ncbi:u9-Nephitoxin-Nsp1a_1 [Caerostris darwini]|uniref:U9-Nephitoxin-Nsp1a_1 n=1 Tax=Caerostris darwini TaxID=1538125 RepID=A0AAV4QZI4_9ARAC|nr:u9-Nephitoxin-Nsp1a_1 [Caerostris darwini]
MNLSVLVSLATVLVAMLVNASTIEEAKALRAAFCDNDETGDEIENCFGQLKKMEVPEEIEVIAKQCCPSVGDRKTGPEVRDWYCNNTAEAIQQCNECQEEKLNELDNQEEIKKLMAPFEDCILHIFTNVTDEI